MVQGGSSGLGAEAELLSPNNCVMLGIINHFHQLTHGGETTVPADLRSLCKYYVSTNVIECQRLLLVETSNNSLILFLAFLMGQAGKRQSYSLIQSFRQSLLRGQYAPSGESASVWCDGFLLAHRAGFVHWTTNGRTHRMMMQRSCMQPYVLGKTRCSQLFQLPMTGKGWIPERWNLASGP